MIFVRLERLQFLNKSSTFIESTVLLLLLKTTDVVLKSLIPREDKMVLKTQKLLFSSSLQMREKPEILVEILHFNEGIIVNITRDTFPVKGQQQTQVVLLLSLGQQLEILVPGQGNFAASLEITATFSIHHKRTLSLLTSYYWKT